MQHADQVAHIKTLMARLDSGTNVDAGGLNADVLREIASAFGGIIRDEDYVASASQQRSAESGVLEHSVFGRNEPALHHYHGTYRSMLGMEPLPLLDRVGAERTS
jgi:hypothetical protein